MSVSHTKSTVRAQGVIENPTTFYNGAIGTDPVLVLAAAETPTGKTRSVKIVVITASRNLAYAAVEGGDDEPDITAGVDGAAEVGSMVMGGGGIMEAFKVKDHLDLYAVTSASGTICNFTFAESE